MIIENKIREKLQRYLRNELSLDQLEDWLAESSWNMHRDSESAAQKLAAAVELRLAEHSSGHLDICALRDELRQFANASVVSISFGSTPLVEELSNNDVFHAKAAVIAFTSQAKPQAGSSPGGIASFDKQLLMEHG